MLPARAALPILLAVALGPATAAGAPKTPFPPPASAGVTLEVREEGIQVPWKLRITNTTQRPVVVNTDPRLLWFDVRVPHQKRRVRCRLPASSFPDRADRRLDVTLAPGQAVEHEFDPRQYCLTGGREERLLPGAFLVPHFGWEPSYRRRWKNGKMVKELKKGPRVVRPPAGAPATALEPTPELVARGIALRSEYIDWSRFKAPEKQTAEDKAASDGFELRVTRGSDARTERQVLVTVRLTNRSQRSRYLYLRREFVDYEVMGPSGLSRCASTDVAARHPDRQAYSRLPPGGSMTYRTRLVELCPRGTFDRPGLYLVHARLVTRHTGARFGLDAFVGEVVSKRPAPVRVRRGTRPFMVRVKMKKTAPETAASAPAAPPKARPEPKESE